VLGFKDGTNNLRRPRDLDRRVWIEDRERSWMLGGTLLVVRRIEVDRERWDSLPEAEQEEVIGRRRASGAPLGREREFDPMPLWSTRPDGSPVIPHDAHARLAAPGSNGGAAMLRRGYAFEEDEPGSAGLVFLAYQRDPRRGFVPVQRTLAERDALARFTRTVGSAVFAIPPGARPGGFLAEGLLAAAGGSTRG
jgi:deferrochelatase/peroxidase EfeB